MTSSRARERRVSRAEILERAQSWLRRPVPYNRTRFHATEHGIYRADCSGYVSMAWGLPGKPPDRYGGLDTVGLAGISTAITKDELLPGDILIRVEGTSATRHVLLFDTWVDDRRNEYWGYEQAGGRRTEHRVVSYPYDTDGALYAPRRYGLVDD